jgi:hypothetical protein
LHSEYADLDLTLSQTSSYFLEVSHHPEVILWIPEGFTNLEEENISSTEINITGRIGNPNSSSRIEITAPKKCTVTINQRRF